MTDTGKTISETIAMLERAREKFGDIEVRYPMEEDSGPYDDTHPILGSFTILNEDETPAYVLIGGSGVVEMN